MLPTPEHAHRIDIATWERRALFELFRDFTEPYHSVCVRVDCTETFRFAKREKLSMFLSLLHRSLIAANRIENFTTRIVDGEVWRYRPIHAGSAVGRDNGTIGFGHYEFRTNIFDFVRDASPELDRVRQRDDLDRFPGQNLIRYSVLPWLDFTSLTHAMDVNFKDSAPRITFGKITEREGRHTMPVAIHVHHALADGLHVGKFVELFERYLAAPEATAE